MRVRKLSDDPAVKTRRRDDVVMDWKRRVYPDESRRPPLQEIAQEAGAVWLTERATGCGFAIETLNVDGYRQQRWYKPGAEQPITLSTLDFAGTLRVVEKLFQGIGPAKAFGCGLLLLRRMGWV